MLFDTHMHTTFSTDSQMTLKEAIQKANEINLGISITEHMDLAYPEPLAFLFDVKQYFNAYGQFRNDKVLLGIEIGMRPDCFEENRKISQQYPFDIVIGSVHVIDDIDLYSPDFYQSRTKREVYRKYFEFMLQCLKSYDFIDTLGHIDYICRYARFDDTQIYYKEFYDYIDPILSLVATRGQAMEINTRRLDNVQNLQQLIPIYKRFRELGGRWITIGSDAHKAQDIGKYMKDAMQIAELCQLTPVYFKNRKPVLLS